MEWNSGDRRDLRVFMSDVLGRQVALDRLLNADPAVVITDDRPFNEYYLLRQARGRAHALWTDGTHGWSPLGH